MSPPRTPESLEAIIQEAGDLTGEVLSRLEDQAAWPGLARDVDDATVQNLLTVAIKLYAAHTDGARSYEPFPPGVVTATDVVSTVPLMLEALELEIFELTPWARHGFC